MANYEPKTRETDASVEDFLRSLENVERQADCFRILEVFKRVTREEPKMWGTAIIGFGHRVLKYESGRELDWPIAAFSRKGKYYFVRAQRFAQAAVIAGETRQTQSE